MIISFRAAVTVFVLLTAAAVGGCGDGQSKRDASNGAGDGRRFIVTETPRRDGTPVNLIVRCSSQPQLCDAIAATHADPGRSVCTRDLPKFRYMVLGSVTFSIDSNCQGMRTFAPVVAKIAASRR